MQCTASVHLNVFHIAHCARQIVGETSRMNNHVALRDWPYRRWVTRVERDETVPGSRTSPASDGHDLVAFPLEKRSDSSSDESRRARHDYAGHFGVHAWS